MRGVWIGKYPHALVSSIYLAAPTIPTEESGIAFLKWIVTDGQPYVAQYGYAELLGSERRSKIDTLTGEPLLEAASTERWATLKIILYIVVGIAATIFLISTIIKSRREERKTNRRVDENPTVINENTLDIPAGLYYDKTHTWAYMDKQGYVKIGIDDFLQHVTGPFTRVEMKGSGEKIKKGEPFLTLVQDGKQLTIQAPISGTIIALNNDLLNEPDLVNQSPYDDGWIYLFKPANWQRELQLMRMSVAYKDWIRNEFYRLRDFLAVKVNTQALTYQGIALQDGGELTDRVMENLGPEVWEEFQKHFVDISY
jgi:glycine cleavage system H lipoate-binding protein